MTIPCIFVWRTEPAYGPGSCGFLDIRGRSFDSGGDFFSEPITYLISKVKHFFSNYFRARLFFTSSAVYLIFLACVPIFSMK